MKTDLMLIDIKTLIESKYGLSVDSVRHSDTGAGSDTYFLNCAGTKYVLKFPSVNEINNPAAEPELCAFLRERKIPASEFICASDGSYIQTDGRGRVFHLQRFFEGKTYEPNTAPKWLLSESARLLGKIHTVLKMYNTLPVGIGAEFFSHMTPERALVSYRRSLETAEKNGDTEIAADLEYRICRMRDFPEYEFALDRLTCGNTHGDYFISQLICGEGRINAVIDWTTACVHPLVWEIIRSYCYAAPEAASGIIDIDGFIAYVEAYLSCAPLCGYDMEIMAKLFYYQIAVCDYYGQFYGSAATNRQIYLSQAVLSTKLMRWFEKNIDKLTAAL